MEMPAPSFRGRERYDPKCPRWGGVRSQQWLALTVESAEGHWGLSEGAGPLEGPSRRPGEQWQPPPPALVPTRSRIVVTSPGVRDALGPVRAAGRTGAEQRRRRGLLPQTAAGGEAGGDGPGPERPVPGSSRPTCALEQSSTKHTPATGRRGWHVFCRGQAGGADGAHARRRG